MKKLHEKVSIDENSDNHRSTHKTMMNILIIV